MASLLDNSRPGTTVTNTATETPVYTVSIPGGTLGTTDLVFAVLLGTKVKNGGGVDTGMVMRVYYGATLVGTLVPQSVNADDPAGIALILHVHLLAAGSTGAQTCHSSLAAAINATTGVGGTVATSYGTAAEDSTGALDLEVTWQQAAVTQHSYTSEAGVVMAV